MDYTPLPFALKRKSNKKKTVLQLLFLLIVILLSLLAIKYYDRTDPINEILTVEEIAKRIFKPKERQPAELKNNIDQALKNSKATYSVFIKNLETNQVYYLHEHKKFIVGSLYKLWVMAVVYEKINKGLINKEEIIKGEVALLNEKFNIASEEAELQEGAIEMTVETALDRMIIVSDNYSALLLTEKIGIQSMKDFLIHQKMMETELEQPPKSTAYDIALFFEKLYKGELASEPYTQKMINLLKKQQINQVLPKYLPRETVIAHKTGDLYSFSHDAGIVYTKKGDYIIVLLSDSEDITGAKERMARISEAVYNYFQK